MNRILCSIAIVAFCAGGAKHVVIDSEVTRARVTMRGERVQDGTELVLRDIRFEANPGTQFHISVARHDDPAKRARVGTLNFYAAKAGAKTSRTFDVTDELRAIEGAGLRDIDVVFESTSGRGDETEAPAVDPRAKLSIGAVELRVRQK